MSLYRFLGQFIRQHWRAYFSAALMLFFVALLTVLIPRKIGQTVDAIVMQHMRGDALAKELLSLALMGMAIYVLRVGWRMQLFSASYRLGALLRLRLYQRLSVQSPAFFQAQRTGDLMALGTNDADAIELAAGEAALAGFDGATTFILVIATMLFVVDWRLAVAALLPFPLMAWAFMRITQRIHDASKMALDSFSDLNDHVQESIAGVRTLRGLGLEQKHAQTFAQLAQVAADTSLQAQRWEAAYEPAVGLSLTTAGALSLCVGAYLVWQHEISIGVLTAFTMYLGQLIWPMFAAGWVFSLLERGKAAWERLHPVLDQALAIQDLGAHPVAPKGALVFENLSFAYPNQQKMALQGINLVITPGQTIGIVGPTGAGKSSLIRLLLRQFEAQQGGVHWGGVAIADYRLSDLRSAMNWVPQEAFLFSASIAANIALAYPEASREQIQEVAQLAAIHEDIMRFPEGYDTPVGERGVTLSGGQKQRLAIARALLCERALLLLDDALSAVDADTESRILSHLQNLRGQRDCFSTVIVSHRLSAVAQADHIIVLRDGCIVEQGRHEDLLANGAWYLRQWQYQQLEASLECA